MEFDIVEKYLFPALATVFKEDVCTRASWLSKSNIMKCRTLFNKMIKFGFLPEKQMEKKFWRWNE